MKVDFFRHDLAVADSARIAEVLATPFITSGSVGKQVEQQLCQFFELPDALLVNSWTNGALAALLALGVRAGDEVIVPAMTFIATANIVELLGAKPVFVDVDAETLLLPTAGVMAALTSRTKAVIPVHLYGQMTDVEELAIMLVAKGRSDVAILEDCAHCFEGRYNDQMPGRFSRLAIFSFYATKNVTCGEGGAIVTRDPALAEALRKTRLHGMSAGAVDRFKQGAYRHWDMETLGVKANLPDLLAALLPNQITTIRARLPKRQALCRQYRDALKGSSIRIQRLAPETDSAEHIFPIHVPPELRDTAIGKLNEAGISVAVNYRSVPTLSYYRNRYSYTPEDFQNAWAWGAGTLTLPLFPSMGATEQQHVIETLLREIAPLCHGRQDRPVGVMA